MTILTSGNVPKFTKEQLKEKRKAYRPNSYRERTRASGPVTVIQFPSGTPDTFQAPVVQSNSGVNSYADHAMQQAELGHPERNR